MESVSSGDCEKFDKGQFGFKKVLTVMIGINDNLIFPVTLTEEFPIPNFI